MNKEVRNKTIADLVKYPDWIVRIECQGLGGEPVTLGGYWEENFKAEDYRRSIIEDYAEYEEEIVRKIFVIERVFKRLDPISQDIIRLKYMLPGNDAAAVRKKLNNMPKTTYHRYLNMALNSYSVALGYRN